MADEFHALMQRVLGGSQSAVQELLKRYEPYLLGAIRAKLNKRMRTVFDSIDFTQAVWKSFFSDLPRHSTFNTPSQLAAFLARLAQNKVITAVRQRLQLQKNNINREQSLDDSRHFDKEALVAPGLSPSETVAKEDEWQAFLKKQPLVYRRIFVLLREGKTASEIALEMDISERTVRRLVKKTESGLAPTDSGKGNRIGN